MANRDIGAPSAIPATWAAAVEERASRREFAHGAQSATQGLLAAVILSRVVGQVTTRRRR